MTKSDAIKVMSGLRYVPLLIGGLCMALGNRLYEVNEAAEAGLLTTAFFPILWAYWMGVAGFVAVLYSFRMDNRRLMAWSGGLVATGFLSRAVAVMLAGLRGTSSLLAEQQHVIGLMYLIAAFSASVIWYKTLGPATLLMENAREADDDDEPTAADGANE